jgi:hypothetical protein
MDTFQRRQRALNNQQRKNKKLAQQGLHAYRADDKQVLAEIKRRAAGKGPRSPPVDHSSPFFSVMADFGKYEKLQKEVAEWKRKRPVDKNEAEFCDAEKLANLSEKFDVDVAFIRAMFNLDEVVKEGTPPPPKSPRTESDECGLMPAADCLESVGRTLHYDPENVVGDKSEQRTNGLDMLEEPRENSDRDAVSVAAEAIRIIVEEPHGLFDEATASANTQETSLPAAPTVVSTSRISRSMAPKLAVTQNDTFEGPHRAKGEKPSATLKPFPLYGRPPSIEIRYIPPQGKEITTCSSKYIPNLHAKCDACERCLYLASAEEKARFFETGHHLRIMMVRGGCDRACSVFPREPDEYPVRLCKKCYFDTHKLSAQFCTQEELRLLWSNSYEL